MRPSITEQLAAVQRVLRDVVAPEVTATYPSDILQSVLGTLAELERSWSRALEHLAWDNEGLRGALALVAPAAAADRRAAIDAVLAAALPDPLDHDAAQGHNAQLRDVAVAVIRDARDDDALRDAIEPLRRHLVDGVRRP